MAIIGRVERPHRCVLPRADDFLVDTVAKCDYCGKVWAIERDGDMRETYNVWRPYDGPVDTGGR